MKRQILVLFLFFSCLALVACGGADDNQSGVSDGVSDDNNDSASDSDNANDDASDDTDDASDDPDVSRVELEAMLTDWLAGSFDSSEQERSDRRFYNISLKGCRVDAPDFGSNTLYIEQAVAVCV